MISIKTILFLNLNFKYRKCSLPQMKHCCYAHTKYVIGKVGKSVPYWDTLFHTLPNLKLTNFWIQPPEIIPLL